jgi:hypothetical protein
VDGQGRNHPGIEEVMSMPEEDRRLYEDLKTQVDNLSQRVTVIEEAHGMVAPPNGRKDEQPANLDAPARPGDAG